MMAFSFLPTLTVFAIAIVLLFTAAVKKKLFTAPSSAAFWQNKSQASPGLQHRYMLAY